MTLLTFCTFCHRGILFSCYIWKQQRRKFSPKRVFLHVSQRTVTSSECLKTLYIKKSCCASLAANWLANFELVSRSRRYLFELAIAVNLEMIMIDTSNANRVRGPLWMLRTEFIFPFDLCYSKIRLAKLSA